MRYADVSDGGVSRSPSRQAGRGPVPFPVRELRWVPLRSKFVVFPLFCSGCVVDLPSRSIDQAVGDRPGLWVWDALSHFETNGLANS